MTPKKYKTLLLILAIGLPIVLLVVLLHRVVAPIYWERKYEATADQVAENYLADYLASNWDRVYDALCITNNEYWSTNWSTEMRKKFDILTKDVQPDYSFVGADIIRVGQIEYPFYTLMPRYGGQVAVNYVYKAEGKIKEITLILLDDNWRVVDSEYILTNCKFYSSIDPATLYERSASITVYLDGEVNYLVDLKTSEGEVPEDDYYRNQGYWEYEYRLKDQPQGGGFRAIIKGKYELHEDNYTYYFDNNPLKVYIDNGSKIIHETLF